MKAKRRSKGRNAQLERALFILRDLSRLDGCDVYELAERHGAAVRTIRRDLEALQAAGIPLEKETAETTGRSKWRLRPEADRAGGVTRVLDAQHFLALRLAMAEAGSQSRQSGLFAALEDLATRIEKAVGPKGRSQLAAIDRCFASWDKHAYRDAPKEYLLPLVQAIDGRRICRVDYRAASGGGEARTHHVLPLRLFVHDRAVYLLCQFRGVKGVGMLNLRRLEKLEVSEEVGRPPKDFDFEKWSEAAFTILPGEKPVRYVLRFAPEVAPYIRERIWHPSQRLRELREGAVELSFTCGESYEVTSWVAGWREWVKVLAPASLRRELGALGRWLGEVYS